MLIKGLCDYYEQLESATPLEQRIPGYCSEQTVHYAIMLSIDGDVTDIIEEEKISQGGNNKKMVPPKVILPKRTQKTAIDSNIVEHRPLYIFGLEYTKSNEMNNKSLIVTEKSQKSHLSFVEANTEFFEDLNSEVSKAYYAFLRNWNPENEQDNKYLARIAKGYSNSCFYFALDGHPEIKLHEDREVMAKYEKIYEQSNSEELTDIEAQCPIEGDVLPVARIHEKIRGLRGGSAFGGTLVGFKYSAYESYGKEQSFNCSVSERAMKKYTSALNSLLSTDLHNMCLDDLTVVFFSLSENDSEECDCFKWALSGNHNSAVDSEIYQAFLEMRHGINVDSKLTSLTEGDTFYVVGLAPNNSRISQKFIVKDKYGSIMDNIIQHQEDLSMGEAQRRISLYEIGKQLVSPKSSKEKVSTSLMTSIFLSALNGTIYPNSLLYQVVRRVKIDDMSDNNHYFIDDDIRVSIIKACLNRKARLLKKEEEFKMSLDKNNVTPAYLCGRLFAVLEKVQRDAAGGELNRTIKDAYFSSACSTPASIFPRLISLSQSHLKKLEYSNYWNGVIEDIIDPLSGDFPQTLSLDDQGKFIIGYYQEKKELYTRRTAKDK